MTWTKEDTQKYIKQEERNQMNIKYITINYIDSKYQIQIKREK